MDNKMVTFKRGKTFLESGHSLFEWLHVLGLDEKFVSVGPSWKTINVKKRPHEVIHLGFDRTSLEKKFFAWYFSDTEFLSLTKEEYETFVKCCQAGHYYLGEFEYYYETGPADIQWLKTFLDEKAV